MQGLADGYFVLPYTIGNYLATAKQPKVTTEHPEFKEAIAMLDRKRTSKLLGIKGKRTVDSFHRELGRTCGSTAAWPATRRA
jgi:succinate dehydrogenase / fumarate reductase flavoprotein subunit